MAVGLLDKTSLFEGQPEEVFESLLLYGDVLMVALFDRETMRLRECNHYFAKSFRITISEKSDVLLDDLLHSKEEDVDPILSLTGEKPVMNILYRYNDKIPLEGYFYEHADDTLLLYLRVTQTSDLEMMEKMSAVTADMAVVSRELRNKNDELLMTRDAMLYQSRMAIAGEIIKMISHQWRQPLMLIGTKVATMQVDLEFEPHSTEGIGKKLDEVSDTVQELSSMIESLRTLYKEDTDFKKVILAPLIDRAVSLLGPVLDDAGMKIVITCDANSSCHTLEAELLQCIVAIVKNSIEAFTTNRYASPMINISVIEKGDETLLVIEDDAGGIADDDLAHVFEPYFSTKSFNGKGLGLYMTKTIADKMDADIALENTAKGLRVTLILPHSSDEGM